MPRTRPDLIDTEFDPDMPIEEPVTSGGDTNQWIDDEEDEENGSRPNGER